MTSSPATIAELQKLLLVHGIPLKLWGAGKAKTLMHLMEEVRLGEAILTETEGRLLREVSVVCLDITRGGEVLEETFQLFYADNRKRERKLDSSTGEKLLPGESPEDGVRRLIYSEFPVLRLQPPTDVKSLGVGYREAESASYPGLTTRYRLHYFTVELRVELPPITVQEADKLSAYRWVLQKPREIAP